MRFFASAAGFGWRRLSSGFHQLISVHSGGFDHLRSQLIQNMIRHLPLLRAGQIPEGLDDGVCILRFDDGEMLGNGRGIL